MTPLGPAPAGGLYTGRVCERRAAFLREAARLLSRVGGGNLARVMVRI